MSITTEPVCALEMNLAVRGSLHSLTTLVPAISWGCRVPGLRFSAKIEGLTPIDYAILRSSSAACAFFSYLTSVAAIFSR